MNWLAVGVWGAVVGGDETSVPQAMLSRPLVAGTGMGLLLGSPAEGMLVGAVLEAFALLLLPIGASRNPETGTAAAAAAAAYVHTAAGLDPPALLFAVVLGLIWERVTGQSVHLLRRVNEGIVPDPSHRVGLDPAALERRHLAAMALDLARGVGVTVTGAGLGVWLLPVLLEWWAAPPVLALGGLVVAVTAVLGAALGLFAGWRDHRRAFGLGLVLGILGLWLL